MNHDDDTLLDLAALQRQVEARIRERQLGEAFIDRPAPLLTTICPDGMPSLLRKK